MSQYDPSHFIKDSNKQYLKQLIKSRRNIKQFSDKVPDEKIIQTILNDTLISAPVKNNIYHYSIEVYGPEHYEAKRALLIQTICSGWTVTGSGRFIDGPDFVLTDKTVQYLNKWDLDDIYDEFNVNTQVLAPYLLVYKLDRNRYRPTKEIEGNKGTCPSDALIQGSMHAMILSLNASVYDIDHGFCKCYQQVKSNDKNIIFNDPIGNLLFILGLGYRAEKPYPSKQVFKKNYKKPEPDQIYKWM